MTSKISLLPLLVLGARASITYYNQCGGTDYTGDTDCETGSNCTVINDYYSQCIPYIIAQNDAVESSSVADLYQQCGGADFTGPTECIAPSTCVYQNPYYSQCLISTIAANTTSVIASSRSSSSTVAVSSSSSPVVVSTSSSSPKASSTTTTSPLRMSTSVKSTATTESASSTTSKTTKTSSKTTTTAKTTTTSSKTTATTTTTTVPSTVAASSTISAVVPTGTTLMATTTHYDDGQEGACGCGTSAGPFSWSYPNGIAENVYTAAGSQALFGDGTWCGSGCGACYNVTSTGTAPPSQGTGGGAGESIIVMVTNLCPYNGNEVWCPNPDTTNEYGYSYHFDIMDGVDGWDNPIVTFEPITCPGVATSDWETCVCATSS